MFRLYKEHAHKLEYNVSFVIYVNFDHVWADYYPVTLTTVVDYDPH